MDSEWIGSTTYSALYTENEKAYGDSINNYKGLTKVATSGIKAEASGDYYVIGPLKVSYAQKTINKIRISASSTNYVECNSGAGTIQWSSNGKSGWSKNFTNIKTDTAFYLRVKINPDGAADFSSSSSLTVTATQQSVTYYKARMVLACKTLASAQQLGFFAANKENYEGVVSWSITDISRGFDLTINKKNEKEEGVQGAKFKIKAVKNGSTYWLQYSNSTVTYTNTAFKSATEFTTNSNGNISITKLDVNYTYTIYETAVPSGYLSLEYQVKNGMTVTKNNTAVTPTYDSTLSAINCGTLTGTSGGTVSVAIKNIKNHTDLTINKKDEIDKSTNITNAKFKIYAYKNSSNNGWVKLDSSTYKYTYGNTYAKATEWSTNSGSVQIYGLSADYTYTIYETKAPDNFLSLEEQVKKGMTITKGNTTVTPKYEAGKGINCGTVSSSSSSQSITFNIKNIEDYLDISGTIWDDKVGTKSDDYDSKYTSTDNLYKGTVKVSLINSSGETVTSTTTTTGTYTMTTPITVTSTMTNNQVKTKLSGYYLKFEYTSGYKEENSTISYYGTVAPSSATTANGSKALPNENEETKGIAYIYDLSSYVNSTNYESNYSSGKHILKNMNMGLVKIQNSYDYNIEQTIAYVKVAINGYIYTYKYGESGRVEATAVPNVQWDNGWAYSRPIYPSDIAYSVDKEWDNSSLKVYVVYKIDIKDIDPNGNSSLKKSGVNNQVSYVETDLKVSSLTNTYDKNRYELETSYDISSNGDFDDWSNDASKGIATYNGSKLNTTIKPNETRTIYIQFKVKNSELEKLLSSSSGMTYENQPTYVTAKAYHNYWKSYYGWNGSKKVTLFAPNKTTLSITKNTDSIYLILELGTERTITGTIFEDSKVSTNGEVLGNGKYDKAENTIKDITVDLLLENGMTASLYGKANNYEAKDATVKSSKDGTYSFVGVTPGKYYIRFTYGDGTQKIINTSGNEVGKVTIKDYKSTIITDNTIKNALLKGNENWYKNVSDIIHSTAVDNLEQRGEYNKDTRSRNTIQASTALTSISIENTTVDTVTVTTNNDGAEEIITGINLGVIKNPKVNIETDKVVTYIRLTNTQGNIIAEGNPASKNIPYVSNLDGNKHIVDGSTYTKIEINEEELYGSKLEIQYSITVQNKSELNYYENTNSAYYGYYYKFGDKNDAKEVTYKVETVYDYIDSSVKSENVSAESPYSIEISSTLPEGEIIQNVDNISDCEYLIKITGWQDDLYSNIVNRTDGKTTYETANMKVSRILSADSSDLEVSNVAQVVNVGKPDTSLLPPVDPQEPTDEVITTVIPPTGSDTLTRNIYIAVIAIAGVIIVAGIVIIKKKVIDK